MAAKKSGKAITVKLLRSPIGTSQRQRKTLEALGLKRVQQTATHTDNPVLRGMIERVSHLVEVQEA